MTEYDQESASYPDSSLRDDLPPVQPPSAGFIVQLFIFPALIVMGVVAIWALFGLVAVGEQDWHKLLQDLQSQNLHVRNRAMYGLAQVLEQDTRRGSQGQRLRENREIAQQLADQLMIELRRNSTSKEDVAIQEFLTRELGMMDPLDITGPALFMALEPQRVVEVRTCAVVSLSYVVGRAIERGEPMQSPESVQALIELSRDPLPVLQQSAAFGLGLFDSLEATQQLEVLVGSGDEMTRVNAAIGLARRGSTVGYSVIRDSLKLADPVVAVPQSSANPGIRSSVSDDHFLVVKNILKAVSDLAPKFDAAQRQELTPLLEVLSANDSEIRIRTDAAAALISLNAAAK